MQEHVTLLSPEESPADVRGLSSSLPPDLMEQVRGRVRLLALLLLIAFSIDPLIYFAVWAIATVAGYPVILGQLGFRLLDLGVVAASGALWWVARDRGVSADRLHTLGLLYQVAICFTLALTIFWQSYLQKGIIPSLTWVPMVVVLFPLLLPGPPRLTLLAAFAAGMMAPLALLVLDLSGKVPDIKPANVFLCRYVEDHGFVKVLDFGLVKAFDDAADPGPALTREHTVHGTPAFIAPEQALGRADLDGRVDIYATGCVAYWLLTGHLVFTADTSMALLLHPVNTVPLAPSGRTEQPIPPALDQLVLSCLAKDPGDRPQSARELARRLEEINGAGLWTEDRAREWWSKHQPAPV